MERKDLLFFRRRRFFCCCCCCLRRRSCLLLRLFFFLLLLSYTSRSVHPRCRRNNGRGALLFLFSRLSFHLILIHRRRQIFPIRAHSIHDTELFSTFGKQICIPI